MRKTQIADLWVHMRSEQGSHKASIGMQERRCLRSVQYFTEQDPIKIQCFPDQNLIDNTHLSLHGQLILGKFP